MTSGGGMRVTVIGTFWRSSTKEVLVVYCTDIDGTNESDMNCKGFIANNTKKAILQAGYCCLSAQQALTAKRYPVV